MLKSCSEIGDVPVRIACLVDGFNLYHSVCDIIKYEQAPVSFKWLNIKKLAESKLSAFNDPGAKISGLWYFTSFPSFLSPATGTRHRGFVKALEATGFQTVPGVFRTKSVKCLGTCGEEYQATVEKQTDVNIALKLFEIYHLDQSDGCILISGDSDLVESLNTCKRLFPVKKTAAFFPYRRWNEELSKSAHIRVRLEVKDYKDCLFAPEFSISGTTYKCPREWR